jgi:hypothetical protein
MQLLSQALEPSLPLAGAELTWPHAALSSLQGVMRVTNATFASFKGAAGCGGAAGGTWAMGNHPVAPDAFHPHFLARSTLVDTPQAALFKLYGQDPDWRNEADCGVATWKDPADGAVIPLNCNGPRHVYFRDTDGSLTGAVSTILGQYDSARRLGYDQGSTIIPGPCGYAPGYSAYSCTPGATTTALGAAFRPQPVPAAGVYGDPQLFVLESRDSDSETRNFGPVMLELGGQTDLLVPAMDQGWCFGYTCQKRLSTFWATAAMGHAHKVGCASCLLQRPPQVPPAVVPAVLPACAAAVPALNLTQRPPHIAITSLLQSSWLRANMQMLALALTLTSCSCLPPFTDHLRRLPFKGLPPVAALRRPRN